MCTGKQDKNTDEEQHFFPTAENIFPYFVKLVQSNREMYCKVTCFLFAFRPHCVPFNVFLSLSTLSTFSLLCLKFTFVTPAENLLYIQLVMNIKHNRQYLALLLVLSND